MARHELTIPVEVEFAEGNDERWALRIHAVNSRRAVMPHKTPNGKRLKFSAAGLKDIAGAAGAVPIVIGDSHEQADRNVLNTVGFSESRSVVGDEVVADAYLLKTDPKAQQLWANAQADPNYRRMVGCSIKGSLDVEAAARDKKMRAGKDDDGDYLEFDGGWNWQNVMLMPNVAAAWKDTAVDWTGLDGVVAAADALLKEAAMADDATPIEEQAVVNAVTAADEPSAPVAGADPNGEELTAMKDEEKDGLRQRVIAWLFGDREAPVAAEEAPAEEPKPVAASMSDEDKDDIVARLFDRLKAEFPAKPAEEPAPEAAPEVETAGAEAVESVSEVAALKEQMAVMSAEIEGLKSNVPVAGSKPVRPVAASGTPGNTGKRAYRSVRDIMFSPDTH